VRSTSACSTTASGSGVPRSGGKGTSTTALAPSAADRASCDAVPAVETGPWRASKRANQPGSRSAATRTTRSAPSSLILDQPLLLNAASKAASGASKASRRTKSSASGAPTSRSIPASSHSIEIGPA